MFKVSNPLKKEMICSCNCSEQWLYKLLSQRLNVTKSERHDFLFVKKMLKTNK